MKASVRGRRVRVRRLLPALGLVAWLAAAAVADEPPGAPRQWAVLIGIQDYEDKGIDKLKVTLRDVSKLREILKLRAGLADDCILEMTDQTRDNRPTLAGIQEKLPEFLERPREGDTLIFYYSGHGIDHEGQAYLVPIDAKANSADWIASLLRASEVGNWLDVCKADVKFLILDACHAGGAKGKALGIRAKPSKGSGQLGQVLASGKKSFVVLDSCKPEELSYEWQERHQSVFTYWLCRALNGAADLDADGRITADEACDYTLRRVQRTIKDLDLPAQTPCREIAPQITGNPVLLTMTYEDPKQLCARLADHLDEEIRLLGLKSVAIEKEFIVKTLDGKEGWAASALPRTLSERFRAELARRAGVGAKSYTVKEKDSGSKGGTPPAEATLFGEIRQRDRGICVQYELLTNPAGDANVRPSGYMAVNEKALANLGHGIDAIEAGTKSAGPGKQPAEVGKEPAEAAPGAPIRLTGLALPAVATNPVGKAAYPFKVEIITTDPNVRDDFKKPPTWSPKPAEPIHRVRTLRPLELDPRTDIISVRSGQRFKIQLTNGTGNKVAAHVLIDGVNPLGKRRELVGEGPTWIIDKGKSIPVEGFFAVDSSPDVRGKKTVKFGRFYFTEMANAVAKRADADEKIGLITVSFFEEDTSKGGAGPGGLGVGEIPEGEREVDFQAFKPGRLLATIQIGYSDDPDLATLNARNGH